MPLSGYEASPGVQVELCTHCRGLFLDRHEIRELVGRGSLAKATEVLPVSLADEIGMRCPKCIDPAMQPLRVKGAEGAESWQCRSCGGLWLGDGAFFALARSLRTSLPATRIIPPAAHTEGPIVHDGPDLAHSRSRYDQGIENLVAVPLVLVLSWLFCSTNFGRLLASLVGMPFHELGHAGASWLSSRIAFPLPSFTFWYDDQSILMGLIVGATGCGDRPTADPSEFLAAAQAGDLGRIEAGLRGHPDLVRFKDADGMTPLLFASAAGRT